MTDYSELKRLVAQGGLPPIVATLIDEIAKIKAVNFDYKNGCAAASSEIERLKSENDRLFKLLERMVNQMLPVGEMKDLPGYSRVLTAEALLAERDRLKAENARLRSMMCGDYSLDEWLDWTNGSPELCKNANRYQHLKATWHDGGLLERLKENTLPEDWDAVVDADIGKEG